LYQDGTKWDCTTRDVPGTKTSGRNGKMWKVENSGATRFLQPGVLTTELSSQSEPNTTKMCSLSTFMWTLQTHNE
jgi:hypothetical protein